MIRTARLGIVVAVFALAGCASTPYQLPEDAASASLYVAASVSQGSGVKIGLYEDMETCSGRRELAKIVSNMFTNDDPVTVRIPADQDVRLYLIYSGSSSGTLGENYFKSRRIIEFRPDAGKEYVLAFQGDFRWTTVEVLEIDDNGRRSPVAAREFGFDDVAGDGGDCASGAAS